MEPSEASALVRAGWGPSAIENEVQRIGLRSGCAGSLAGYFTYQWWPTRDAQSNGSSANWRPPLGPCRQLRRDRSRHANCGSPNFFAQDVHVTLGGSATPTLISRDAVLSAVGSWNPSARRVEHQFRGRAGHARFGVDSACLHDGRTRKPRPQHRPAGLRYARSDGGNGGARRRVGHYDCGADGAEPASLTPATIHRRKSSSLACCRVITSAF